MKVFGLEDIKRVLPKIDLTPLIKEGFVAYSSGLAVVPPVGELLFENPPGDVHIKYGYIQNEDYYVVKIASGFYGNLDLNIPSNQGGMMILFEQKTGKEVGVLIDQCYLTNVRTAIAGAICAELFAPNDLDYIGVIGTGVQARMQINYLSNLIDCKNIKVWGRGDKSVEKYIEEMSLLGWDIERANTTDEIAATCDLIITATPSKVPLLKSENLKQGTHINAVGSDSSEKNEVDNNIFKMADLIVADSISQCLERGEISHGIKSGTVEQKNIRELGSLIKSKDDYRCQSDQITFADLTGVAVQDIQIAKAVFKECEKLEV
jgi:ornithine cyclodeaminase|tara:strand:+ start:3559 stop:4518 length:960 start_codon:yes stop_codon:yes gene_type:complete